MDDPWVMYYVVRKDLRMDLAAACALAGGAAVACTRAFEDDPRCSDAFAAWRPRPRKVALRADAEQLAAAAAQDPPGWTARLDGEPALLCLTPRPRSQAGDLLASLIPFTDARRPGEPTPPPPADVPALTYVVAAQLRMTQGKSMAQAGHGALLCADSPDGDRGARAGAWEQWARAGRPGRVLAASADEFEAACAVPAAVVVRDAGLTQVAAGAATVVCLPPQRADELPTAVAALAADAPGAASAGYHSVPGDHRDDPHIRPRAPRVHEG